MGEYVGGIRLRNDSGMLVDLFAVNVYIGWVRGAHGSADTRFQTPVAVAVVVQAVGPSVYNDDRKFIAPDNTV
jgi:hypothetical protein